MATTPGEKAADEACAAHIKRLCGGAWLGASTITPQVVTLYTDAEPQGVHIPSSASTLNKDGEELHRGGTLEAFVNEMEAFASAAGTQVDATANDGAENPSMTYRTIDGDILKLPAPSYSFGEVAIAQALYRSAAADGRIERTNVAGSAL